LILDSFSLLLGNLHRSPENNYARNEGRKVYDGKKVNLNPIKHRPETYHQIAGSATSPLGGTTLQTQCVGKLKLWQGSHETVEKSSEVVPSGASFFKM
jgi:hypothetical protein